MTAYRFVTLTCDVCGEISDGGMDRTVKGARATAKAEGWKRDERGDTCPGHNGWTRMSYGWERDHPYNSTASVMPDVARNVQVGDGTASPATAPA